jgi:hypothetical protein
MLTQPLADGVVEEVLARVHRFVDELIEVMLGVRRGGRCGGDKEGGGQRGVGEA